MTQLALVSIKILLHVAFVLALDDSLLHPLFEVVKANVFSGSIAFARVDQERVEIW